MNKRNGKIKAIMALISASEDELTKYKCVVLLRDGLITGRVFKGRYRDGVMPL